MSERIDKDIEIKDLPAEETLTPEEKELLAGAGRQAPRPTLEALETRQMMDVGIGGMLLAPVPQSGRGAEAQVRHMPAAQPITFDMTAAHSQGSATGANQSGIDLHGMDLTHFDLSKIDLRGANLSGANLSGVDLSGRDVSGANLSGANLSGANLSGAKLDGAIMDGAAPHTGKVGTLAVASNGLNAVDLSGKDLTNATSNAAGKVIFSDNFTQPVGTLPSNKTWYQNHDNQKDPNNNNVTYTNAKDTLRVVDDLGAQDGKALALTINKVGEDKHNNPLFHSARITTQIDPVAGHLEYGRVEARIKLEKAEGSDPVWPAFWMLGSDLAAGKETWPKCGEIDILEYNGNAGTSTGTLVTPDHNYTHYNQYKGASLGDGQYHTFAIDWSPGSVTFSVDGNAYATVKMGDNKGEIPATQWNFNKPFYVILNVAAFPGQKADFTSQTMYVDYVRAYAPGTPTNATANNLTLTGGAAEAAGAEAGPATTVETPAANRSAEQEDIRQKLEQIQQVEAILKGMDVPDLPYAQWLAGQAKKLQALMGADQAELKLKQAEIQKLESQPDKATVLAEEKAELAIMQDKMAKMIDLQTAIEQAQQGQQGADQRVADLIHGISKDELKLKNQQVAALQDRIKTSPSDKQPALQKLLQGEQYEVEQLKKINALNKEIADLVGSSDNKDANLASLRRRETHHELLMKEQNEHQLEARLKPASGALKGDGAAIQDGPGTAAGSEVTQVPVAGKPPALDTTTGSNSALANTAGLTAAANAHVAATPTGYSKLKGVELPTGPHLTTEGTINIAFADGTERIHYKETNPKMFGATTADNGLWEMRLPVMAAQFLNGAANTDMIFLDAEVDPGRLMQLMNYSLPDAHNPATSHKLADYFSVVNVEGTFTGDRGGCPL